MSQGWTYRRAGVDVSGVRQAQKKIFEILERTRKFSKRGFGEVLTEFGHYAALVSIGPRRSLAIHVDGCGTKVLIAQMIEKYDTIGIDCVAMCINDLICVGAQPISFVDYIAVEEIRQVILEDIMRGLARGAEMAKITIVGGETAVMPDVIHGAIKGRGFDLVGMAIGVVKNRKPILGDRMAPGDFIIGLASSGIHSNGFTLARKVLLEKFRLQDQPEGLERTLGEELLEPTRIYADEVMRIISKVDIHAIAHITGGGFTKLQRFSEYSKYGFLLDHPPRPNPIFQVIQNAGAISDEEMYRTFNMGVGLCLVCSKAEADKVLSISRQCGTKAEIIGKIVKGPGVTVATPNSKLDLSAGI